MEGHNIRRHLTSRAVSYTHLDVYKRQCQYGVRSVLYWRRNRPPLRVIHVWRRLNIDDVNFFNVFLTLPNLFLLFFYVIWRWVINFLKICLTSIKSNTRFSCSNFCMFYSLDIPNNDVHSLPVVQINIIRC